MNLTSLKNRSFLRRDDKDEGACYFKTVEIRSFRQNNITDASHFKGKCIKDLKIWQLDKVGVVQKFYSNLALFVKLKAL